MSISPESHVRGGVVRTLNDFILVGENVGLCLMNVIRHGGMIEASVHERRKKHNELLLG